MGHLGLCLAFSFLGLGCRESRIMMILSSTFHLPPFICWLCAASYWLLAFFDTPAVAARIKDVAQIEGFRSNQLYGYGLVVGLEGTGDRQKTEFTVQSLTNLLQDYRIRVFPNDVRVKNVAAVMVTAEIPPYSQPGTRLDAVA